MAVEHPSSRMRFMLKDLVDMRKAGWVERRETEKAVKLSELRGEEAPSGGKGHSASRASSSSNISSFGSKSQDARASRAEPAADEWSVVPEKSKAKVRAPGSGGFGQSSSANSSAKSSNAFSALGKTSGSLKSKDAVKASGSKVAPSVTKKSNAVERVAAAGGLRTESPALSDTPDEEGVGMERSVSFGVSDNGDSPRSVAGQAGAGGAPVDKAVIEQVKRFVTGYFSELEKDDVTESIQSIVHPDGMGDIIRPCILLAFDKREADRENLVNLFVHLYSEGVLRTEQVARGLSAFLDDLDETAIDVPMAASYGANMLAVLVVQDVINLSFLTQLPDEHNFPTSPRAAAFIGQTISFISKLTSPESAAAMYKASGLDLKQQVVPGPKESAEQAYEELLARYAIQFI
jgi:translation initiation factor 4G